MGDDHKAKLPTALLEIKDVLGLSAPLERLVQAIAYGVGEWVYPWQQNRKARTESSSSADSSCCFGIVCRRHTFSACANTRNFCRCCSESNWTVIIRPVAHCLNLLNNLDRLLTSLIIAVLLLISDVFVNLRAGRAGSTNCA